MPFIACPRPSPLCLPGLGLPLDHRSEIVFPTALFQESHRGYESVPSNYPLDGHRPKTAVTDDRSCRAPLLAKREYTMMEIMNRLTDKPGWEEKIFREVVVRRWKAEVLATPDQDVSEKMFDYCIEELRHKTAQFKERGCVETLDGVWKRDNISEELRIALQKAIKPLENVPEKNKDWHPNSNEQVLDLVHPSIYPLVYGQTRILPNTIVSLSDCISRCGHGIIDITGVRGGSEHDEVICETHDSRWSMKYQWLPAEFATPAGTDEVQITSYINNLHPFDHKDLYILISKFVAHAIPMWNLTLFLLTCSGHLEKRLEMQNGGYVPEPEKAADETASAFEARLEEWKVDNERPEESDDEEDTGTWYQKLDAWQESRWVMQPDPEPFRPPTERSREMKPPVDLREDFDARLQIIVKLANIHLTPEKPSYEGGSWHVEGMANEAICATALYYYDCENIGESLLSFRQHVNSGVELPYEQNDFRAVQEIYGFENEGPTIQDLGSVVCREGRLLTFPNIMQHCVSPFHLLDTTKPGHRKILALFLVDPHQRIISTRNVPCQQHKWWADPIRGIGPLGSRLPWELTEQVLRAVDFPVLIETAKEQRLELMEERKNFMQDQESKFESYNTFNLCEH